MSNAIHRPARDIPIAVQAEVLVCGGGPAGTAAALAAARQGAKVALIERYNHLGGLATGGLVLVLPHFVDHGRQIIGGIGLETRDTLVDHGLAAFREGSDSSYFDPEALKWLSVKLCREAGIEVLHHCWLSDAIVEGGRVRGVVFESKSGSAAALADVVVDATGDGDIYAWAGADFEQSHQAIGLPFRVGGIDMDRWMSWVRDNPEASGKFWADLQKAIDWPDAFYIAPVTTCEGVGWGNNYHSVGDGLDFRTLSHIEVDARLKIHEAISILRGGMAGFEKAWLIDTASQLGVRRTRRLKGVEWLTGEQTAEFDYRHADAIGRGNDFRREGPAYDIPYGCLVPASLDGLVTGGRCLSCDHDALEPIREIHVCWVTGEAAGAAATMAVQRKCQPREVPVSALQERLRAVGVAFAD
jgi:hypothetical protein